MPRTVFSRVRRTPREAADDGARDGGEVFVAHPHRVAVRAAVEDDLRLVSERIVHVTGRAAIAAVVSLAGIHIAGQGVDSAIKGSILQMLTAAFWASAPGLAITAYALGGSDFDTDPRYKRAADKRVQARRRLLGAWAVGTVAGMSVPVLIAQ